MEKQEKLETKHIQIGSFEFAMRSLNLGFKLETCAVPTMYIKVGSETSLYF